jgi:hypothetical protein
VLRQLSTLNRFHLLLKLTLAFAFDAATGKFSISCRVLFWFLIVFQDNLKAFFLTCTVVGIIDN